MRTPALGPSTGIEISGTATGKVCVARGEAEQMVGCSGLVVMAEGGCVFSHGRYSFMNGEKNISGPNAITRVVSSILTSQRNKA